MSALPRPADDEYVEYYRRYVAMVPDGDILETLRDQLGDTLELLKAVPSERETYRYAEGKWSLREVIGHLIDTERVFAFRALTMARSKDVDLPGMDQDEWVATSNAAGRSLADLTAEWTALRRSNVHMFAGMDAAAGARSGVASGNRFSVRSFAWIMAGHELWHRQLIKRDYLGVGA
ncbi:MAG: DinB family protein [Gemmatimonadetes bacterium]|nr:DinB family protein [Gemmatimonadota bacterium]MDA1102988.1 DinB family protein [Gemmatimonadota bacterium]